MNKRKALGIALFISGLLALALAASPFVASLLPSAAVTPKYLEVAISEIPLGSYQVIEWNNLPIAIVRPSSEMLATLETNTSRTWNSSPLQGGKHIFVFAIVSPGKNCGLQHERKASQRFPADANWPGGFVDNCQFGEWDYAGRALKLNPTSETNTRLPDLPVPRYEVLKEGSVVRLLSR